MPYRRERRSFLYFTTNSSFLNKGKGGGTKTSDIECVQYAIIV